MPGAAQRPVVLDRAFERFPGQVEAVELGVTALQAGQDAQSLVVMREPAKAGHFGIEGLLAGMAERGMAEIVGQRQCFGQILVEAESTADRACDLGHLEAVGEPRPVVVALVVDKDLRLMGQPAESRAMNDAVAVALKCRPHRMLGLRMEPSARLLRLRRKGRETGRRDHARILRRVGAGVHHSPKTKPQGRAVAVSTPRRTAPIRPVAAAGISAAAILG